MKFELTKNYDVAFELIKKGDRPICLINNERENCKDVAFARWIDDYGLIVTARGTSYLHLTPTQSRTNKLFIKACKRLDVEFFIPED